MPRLIDADALMSVPNVCKVTEYDESGCGVSYLAVPVEAIEKAPTIDAEPVRHGRWIPVKVCSVETKFKCSECNRTIIVCNDYFGRATEWASSEYPYCHCGAKMNEGELIQ